MSENIVEFEDLGEFINSKKSENKPAQSEEQKINFSSPYTPATQEEKPKTPQELNAQINLIKTYGEFIDGIFNRAEPLFNKFIDTKKQEYLQSGKAGISPEEILDGLTNILNMFNSIKEDITAKEILKDLQDNRAKYLENLPQLLEEMKNDK